MNDKKLLTGATVYFNGVVEFHDDTVDERYFHEYFNGYGCDVNVFKNDDISVMREDAKRRASEVLRDLEGT